MQSLFTALSHAVLGSPAVALGAAFVWGGLSMVLSPCHLAGIPLIVGFMSGQHGMTTRRACATAASFAFGMLLCIAAVGVVTVALGRLAGDLGGWVNYAVAGVFFAAGLHLLGVFSLPSTAPSLGRFQGRGLFAAMVLGLVFGLALGPCTFAYMAPVMGGVFHAAKSAPIYAAGLLLAYGVGHCGVIIAAGTFAQAVQTYLNWNRDSRGVAAVRPLCGVLVLCGGLFLLYTAN